MITIVSASFVGGKKEDFVEEEDDDRRLWFSSDIQIEHVTHHIRNKEKEAE